MLLLKLSLAPPATIQMTKWPLSVAVVVSTTDTFIHKHTKYMQYMHTHVKTWQNEAFLFPGEAAPVSNAVHDHQHEH